MDVRRSFASLVLTLVVVAGVHAAEPTSVSERARLLAPIVGYGTWPSATEHYPLPAVDRGLVPDRLSDLAEIRGCRAVVVGGEPWPECTWSWTTARDAAGRTSWLEVVATLTPDSTAASAYLLAALAGEGRPTEDLVEQYRTAERPGGLGSVSFKIDRTAGRETMVHLQRGNLVLSLRGHGDLRTAALPAAYALDRAVLGEEEVGPAVLRAQVRRLLGPDATQATETPHE